MMNDSVSKRFLDLERTWDGSDLALISETTMTSTSGSTTYEGLHVAFDVSSPPAT
jgi:hypothetical protein